MAISLVQAAADGVPRWRQGFPGTDRATRDRRHLEGDRPAVPQDLGADLHQPISQCRQRRMIDCPGQHQGAQEVGEIVGQHVELQPHGFGGEAMAGPPRPGPRPTSITRPKLRA